ncbi:SIR2 family NAD-dependent protein deacylase [Halalkalibacter urbisdiaboli]|uniref:SIR2 family NAD-dependent protein deacylase n=1 Tax=Halalkalibacter urbisdiaboli TaxID=1960589 RepID=UPI000B441C9A|nr:NAD-dependent deacylase [Halalkalibacter urbisdiaboli]
MEHNGDWKTLSNEALTKEEKLKWAKVCYPELVQLVQLLQSSTYTVVLTGAGMSTESGIPDFRSQSGWWKNIDPRKVATVDALEEHYSLFQEFYQTRVKALENIEPHIGHYILAKWEKKNLIQAIATQNVDGLHQKSGSKTVYPLHGSIRSFRCHHCDQAVKEEVFMNEDSCSICGGKLRPNVVLFGETLPSDVWDSAYQSIEQADLVIVIGTSLEVYPVNELPSLTKGKTVLVNVDEVSGFYPFDVIVKGKAKEVLEKLNELLEL